MVIPRRGVDSWKTSLSNVLDSNFVLLQVATFILQKILLDDTGLAYICQTYERFSHVAMILVSSFLYLFYFINLAVLGLSCGLGDLLLQRVGFFPVVTPGP